MSDAAVVTIARDGPVARVTLDRPQLHNAFDEALIAGLTDAFQALGEDAAVRVVVLTGAGKSFSAGADLNWMKRAAAYDEERNRDGCARARADAAHDRRVPQAGDRHGQRCRDRRRRRAGRRLRHRHRRGGRAVRHQRGAAGHRAGGDRARSSCARSARARRGAGSSPPSGSAPRRRGGSAWCTRWCRPTSSRRGPRRWSAELLKGGPEALAEAKRLVQLVEMMPQGGSIRAEATVGMIAERRASAEGREGIAAFLEKRKPAWIGG